MHLLARTTFLHVTPHHHNDDAIDRSKAGIFTIQQSTTWLFENNSNSIVSGVALAAALAEALVVVLAVALTVARAVALAVAGPLDVTRSSD